LTLSSPLQKVEEAIGTTGNIRKLKKHSHLEEVDETLTHEEVEEELALTLTIGEYQPDKYWLCLLVYIMSNLNSVAMCLTFQILSLSPFMDNCPKT